MWRRLCSATPVFTIVVSVISFSWSILPLLLLSTPPTASSATLTSISPTTSIARRVMVLGAVIQLFQFGNDNKHSHLADAATTSADNACLSSSSSSSSPASTTGTVIMDDVVVEGVSLPPVRVLPDDGMILYRNGHGIRSIPFFGMNIKVYVAHLYSRRPLNEEAALALIEDSSDDQSHHGQRQQQQPHNIIDNHHHHYHHNPLHFDFTFLRHVGRSRVVSAWTQQLEHSVSHRYDGYEQDRDRFIQLSSTGHIEHGGTQTVQLVGNETRIIDQGQHKGTIEGHGFQKSFLSMWIGPKAVAEDLKRNLFQGHVTTATSTENQQRIDRCESESDWIPLPMEEDAAAAAAARRSVAA